MSKRKKPYKELNSVSDCVHYTMSPAEGQPDGWFDHGNGMIYINSRLPLVVREMIFAHENQHRKCFNHNCKCWNKNSDFLTEYHAYQAEIKFVYDKNDRHYDKMFLITVNESIKRYTKYPIDYEGHLGAVRKIMKTKMFKEIQRRSK